MKLLTRISSLGCIVSLLVCLLSCSGANQDSHRTVFAGKIVNIGTTKIRIETPDTALLASVNADGTFNLVFDLDEETFFDYVGDEMTTIHLSPGDSLFMTADEQDWRTFDRTLSFSGTGGLRNTYYQHKSFEVDRLFDSNEEHLMDLAADEFMTTLDSLDEILLSNYRTFRKEHPGEKSRLLKLEPENIHYLKLDYFIRYCLHSTAGEQNTLTVKEKAEKMIAGVDPDNQAHAGLDAYRNLVNSYLEYGLHTAGVTGGADRLTTALIRIDREIQTRELKEQAARYFLEQYITNNRWKDNQLSPIQSQITGESYQLYQEISDKLRPVSPGDPAPDFVLFDTEGKEYTLASFKGSYLYIDVWATYCGPCIREIPSYEDLKRVFGQKNIRFISVSLDRNERAWKAFIRARNMTDYQLAPDNDWGSDFARDYSLNYYGIPHYILINPGGIILQAPAPLPSRAEDLLKDLLD